MTPRQASALRTLTNKLCRYCYDGELSFSVDDNGSGFLVFGATNIYSDGFRWYWKTYDFYAVIGPRGGVRVYKGSIKLK
jgi:hypothetical protein